MPLARLGYGPPPPVRRRDLVEATDWTEAEALGDLARLVRARNVERVGRAAD
jgi:hypothetical protein